MSKSLTLEQSVPSRDDLQPSNSPNEDLKIALDKIGNSNADWNHHLDAVTTIRSLIVHHTEIVTGKQKAVVLALIECVDNLRSLVSKNAIQGFAELFCFVKKGMDAELEIILPALLKKYSEKLYETETDKALQDMSDNVSRSKAISCLINSATHKNAVIRQKVSWCLHNCVLALADKILKIKDLNKLLQALAALATDGGSETRTFSKAAIFSIFTHVGSETDFDKLISKLSTAEIRTLKEVVQKYGPKPPATAAKVTPPQTPTKSEVKKPATPAATTPKKTETKVVATTTTTTPVKKVEEKPALGRSRGAPPKPDETIFHSPMKAPVVIGADMEENITVAVRVRPLDAEESMTQRELWKVENDTVSCSEDKRSIAFNFDHVYGPSDKSTEQIYTEVGKDIVQSVMEGYNGTIFAYGQTASGKTYTMMGTDDNHGFIPLAINSVFEYIQNNVQREFLLRVSYLEIYNEVINDLLRPEGSNLSIREDPKKGIFVEGLKEEIVVSPDHVLHIISGGEAHRHVASTDYNLMSSRSHTVFRIIIESTPVDESKDIRVSALTLIDLAGSEKVMSTDMTRKREGAYINKSLLTLGTIISKLSERKKGEKIGHMPYRDSKLTRILEPVLGGNSRIAILATASPSSVNFEETHNTFKFAQRAKKITNKAKYSSDTDKTLLIKYRQEIDELKQKLEVANTKEQQLSELHETQSMEENSEEISKKLEDLKQELQEQEGLRVSLEEKIKQLTKLILSSTNANPVGSTPAEAPAVMSRRQRSSTATPGLMQKYRSLTLTKTPSVTSMPAPVPVEEVQHSGSSPAEVSSTEAALQIKISALQEQAEWMEKMITKMRAQIKEKDDKISHLLTSKMTPDMEQWKANMEEQWNKQIEQLQETIQEKEFEVEVQKADNQFLREKFVQKSEQ